MQKILYIAEKPSVAAALAYELGSATKQDGYFQVGDTHYISWLYGHILRMYEAQEYDEKYKKWSLSDLPIIPSEWKNASQSGGYAKALRVIRTLTKEVDVIVNAGDPDREGQLLVDEVLEFISNKKPVLRLFINALDSTSIQRALNSLEDNAAPQNRNRYYSALARQRSDWLFGINATRKFTVESGTLLKVGRVKTPTLALVVNRNNDIANFKPIKHFGITGFFTPANSISFSSTWQPNENFPTDEENRVVDILAIRELEQKINSGSKLAIVREVSTKLESQNPPLPFSLSKLQQEAGKKFGLTPTRTLELAQALYEKKLTSYPRSSSEHIPESQHADAAQIISNIKVSGVKDLSIWAEHAVAARKSRAFNDKKVDAHHAIIPTLIKADIAALNQQEKQIYWLIARNYLAQFYMSHACSKTVAIIELSGEIFKASGSVVTTEGWKVIFSNDANQDEQTREEFQNKKLTNLIKGQEVDLSTLKIVEKLTEPAKPFTQDTLIAAMENIHKYVTNPDLKTILKETKGIGTEATRASIIKDLLDSKLLIEETVKSKKILKATDIGKTLIEALPKTITSADMTALMESQLDEIASGRKQLSEYMLEQEAFIKELVSSKSNITPISTAEDHKIKCPVCPDGHLVKITFNNSTFWGCSNYRSGCKLTYQNKNNKPIIVKCPKCGSILVQRKGKSGVFWACSAYPSCKETFQYDRGLPKV